MSGPQRRAKAKPAFNVVPPPDKSPPSCIESETYVLGSIIFDPSTLGEVRRIIRPGDFWLADHQAIYDAVLALDKAGSPIDPASVVNALEQAGQFERIGGIGVITKLASAIPHAKNAPYHASIMREKGAIRSLIERANDIIGKAYMGETGADELLAEARRAIEGIPGAALPDAASYATMADVARVIGEQRWLWPGWIPQGALTIVSAKGGVGKTRLLIDLAKRLYCGEPWPDGSPATLPAGSRTLWLCPDRNFQGITAAAPKFGLSWEAMSVPAPPNNPLFVPEIDEPETLHKLEAQIRCQSLSMLIVDTITYATGFKTGQADEAKKAFDGLMDLAARTGVAILGLTHLSKEGETLGRRIEERARVNIHLTAPVPDNPLRLRLSVRKTEALRPPPLGITLGPDGNTYDTNPPDEAPPGGSTKGPAPVKSTADATWLIEQLEDGQWHQLKYLIDSAKSDEILATPKGNDAKVSLSPLYEAKKRVPKIRSGWFVDEMEETDGGRTRKFWRLAQEGLSPPGDSDEERFDSTPF